MKTKSQSIKQKSLGFHANKELFAISVSNNKGSKLSLTNFAASIMSMEVKNKSGGFTNVVVGFDDLNDYVEKSVDKVSRFLGASIGRYSGRISGDGITVNNVHYPIYNEQRVHLHGGKHGFDERVWDIEYIDEDNQAVTFSYFSEHLEEGYPGNLWVKVIYQLTDDDELRITYRAVSDQDTVINLTNHAYYNLNGEGSVLDHVLQLNCSNYLEVDEKQIPTGSLKNVENTRFDYRKPKELKKLSETGIIDDTLVFEDRINGNNAVIFSPKTGISMAVQTNQPSVVIFTPKKFEDWKFKNDTTYGKFPAICFETQNYPDAPNHLNFPSSVLKANEHYENYTSLKFKTADDQ
ncbi:galactose mutarotase [Aquimarina sp. D1M17]|uniref:aldose epimerase family protein n=1 Tax=Aquimarina acroporae TaxID=2937283 RepID=UPI0020C02427|nr:aldose epimerase family protein [Aquimarina acroporae]MCK8521751.1 galactose mutarotase [Aquimarina acroporae]